LWILHKIKFIIPISIAAALIAGFVPQIGRSMSLSRTITFLPFFLMGFFFDKEKIKYIKEKLRGSVWFFLFASLFSIIMIFKKLPVNLLYFADSYYNFDIPITVAFFTRLFIFGAAITICLCILLLIPEVKYTFTYLGENSFYIFILHSLLIHFVDPIPQNNWWSFSLYIITSGIIVYIFGNRIFCLTIKRARERTLSWITNLSS
jgi:fucose 4-O-acetylase-like acetyltransferase